MLKTLCFFVFMVCASVVAQKEDYAVTAIPDSLKQNANAVVRSALTDITISSQRKMKIYTKRVVTVFNEKGLSALNAYEHYDKSSAINSIDAVIYNAFGNEIKKAKRSDFKDQSAADGVTMFSDSRVVYLEFTPTDYPFTMVYESEKTTSSTAFIPFWLPIDEYYLAVEKSMLRVHFPDNLGFRKKESHFSGFDIAKTTDTATGLTYELRNCVAQKPEDQSPGFSSIFPKVMMGLEVFNLEGVDGTAKTWKEFGQWYANQLLAGTTEIPEATQAKIKALVGDEKDPLAKARIVYRFVQEKSRYVSIQVGIGGFKPMYAKDVDRLGYGDCKALSNYTKALLEVVGVPAYNTILYGDRGKMNIDGEFVSVQGNHMILCIPNGNDYVWLECTSQDDPFGYQANFTDDRDVLVIKPEGGQIVHTKIYPDQENSQISKGSYTINDKGGLSGTISLVSQGAQYGRKARIAQLSPQDKEAHYKNYWDNINNLKLGNISLSDDKEKVAFAENIEISATGYAALSGNSLMFPVNAFNQMQQIPQRYRSRKQPFEIQRGFWDQDDIEITLPENYVIEAMPSPFEFGDKFGQYKAELVKIAANKLAYKRSFLLKHGLYDKTDYENYRKFMEQVAKSDNSKIVLTKKI